MKRLTLLPGILLLIASVFIGILTYQDYGVGWDESTQRDIGMITYNYLSKGDTTLNHFSDRDHGSAFELVLVFLEKKITNNDWRDIVLLRHITTNVFFLLCCFCGYVLALRLFKNQWLACLAFFMLAFHPRLYGQSFVNTKDIPFLGMYVVAFLVAHVAFEKRTWAWMLLLGAVVGYATGIRLLSILLAAILALVMMVDIVFAIIKKEGIRKPTVALVCFVLGFCIMLYISWPALWSNPFGNFILFYKNMSHFGWGSPVLFMGDMIIATDLPFTYIPVWFAITTPIVWLVLGIAGIVYTAIHFFRQPVKFIRNTNQRHLIIYVLCTLVPVAMVIFLHSVLYDDWRHLYFIYPSFVMLALYALTLIRSSIYKKFISYAIGFQLLVSGWDMYRLHPFERIYFNRLVSHERDFLRYNYEMDYWGTGYKQAFEYLIAHAPEHDIKVLSGFTPLGLNASALQLQDRDRIKFVNEDEAVYHITNFRFHPEDYPGEIYHDIKKQNSTIIRIYKLR